MIYLHLFFSLLNDWQPQMEAITIKMLMVIVNSKHKATQIHPQNSPLYQLYVDLRVYNKIYTQHLYFLCYLFQAIIDFVMYENGWLWYKLEKGQLKQWNKSFRILCRNVINVINNLLTLIQFFIFFFRRLSWKSVGNCRKKNIFQTECDINLRVLKSFDHLCPFFLNQKTCNRKWLYIYRLV